MISPRRFGNIPEIKINDAAIGYVYEFRYLGLLIDGGLKFSKHALSLNKRLSSIVGTVYSL